jgi:uncharacterized lipoprotein YmbA
MMRRLLFPLGVITLVVYLISVGGCASSTPTNFYVLTPSPGSESLGLATLSARGPSVGLGPVTLPQYLDRPQIVSRASRAKLNLAEFDQWGAPLKDNVASVLAENVSTLVPTDHITVHPWSRSASIDYQIVVDITRFDGSMDGGEVLLLARWRIVGKDGKELVKKKSRVKQQVASADYEGTVTAMSRALEALSQEMVNALHNVLR